MNTKFLNAWAVLAIMAFTIPAFASKSSSNEDKYTGIITIRTAKVNGTLVGYNGDLPPVGIDCGSYSANIVFPDSRTQELNTDHYNSLSRSNYTNRGSFRRLSDQAFNAVCSNVTGKFDLDFSQDVVQLKSGPISYSAKSWNDVLKPN